VRRGGARLSQAAEKVRFERFVTGHDFTGPEKVAFGVLCVRARLQSCRYTIFIFLPEPALAGGTGPCFDFFRSLFQACIDE
jgi:hypothetical protein